jgi:hypothetical protein
MVSAMVMISSSAPRGFLALPFTRILGSVAGWFLYLLSFTLLVQSFVDVQGVGGYCASGQSAYVIAHQCPPGATIFIPWCIFSGLIAVGIGVWLSGGFGVPIAAWAWPILFCVLGAGFLGEGIVEGDIVGWILGIMFEVMGVIPLILALRASAPRVFIGTINVGGQRFSEGPKARSSMILRAAPNTDGGTPARLVDVLLALFLAILSGFAGVYVALLWYANVAS